MTLEDKIDAVSAELSAMTDRTKQPDEWQLINDMHLTIYELRGQLSQLRDREMWNKRMKN